MDLDGARSALDGCRFADLRWVPDTGSTNSDVMSWAADEVGECVLVADHQSAGRGRLDRTWEAPPGASLLMSILVRPPFPTAGVHALPTALGVASVDAVVALGGAVVGLKWPNDLVVPGAGPEGADLKAGGMLGELHTGPPSAVVLGIGVNLSWAEVPTHLVGTATALDLEGPPVDRWRLVVEMLRGLERELADVADLGDRYRERCVTIGRRVRVELPRGELVGVATDVAADGALVVLDDAGDTHTVTVGDVVHLRPV